MEQIHNAKVIVDDDQDDLEIIAEAYYELGVKNELILLRSADALVEYLHTHNEAPFFILCDYHMPKMNGLQLRERLLSDPATRYKSFPFLLLSTSGDISQIQQAYDKLIQGFFLAPQV